MSISVNGAVIADREVQREAQAHLALSAGAPSRERAAAAAPSRELAALAEAAQALVVRRLLLEEAERRGLLPQAHASQEGPDSATCEEAAVRALMEAVVPVPDVSEAACRRFYEDHRDRFRGPDLFEPSHILFAAPPDGAEARAEAYAEARRTLAELVRDPDRFERIAQKRSACPSGARGGSLGQLTRGETEPPFERHILALEVGAIATEPVETDHGFHIVRLDHRARGERLPYDVVADRIRIYLRDHAWRRAVHGYIGDLMARAEIDWGGFRPPQAR